MSKINPGYMKLIVDFDFLDEFWRGDGRTIEL